MASASPSGIVSGFLSLFGLGGSGGSGAPMEFITAALSLIRREITRLFANHGPSASPYVISETAPGTVTGSINASDPEGDPLSYTVVEGPEAGSVSVGADGSFTYVADEELAASGGTDSFVVEVRDTGFHLFGGAVTTLAPVTVVVNATDAGPGGRPACSGGAAEAAATAKTTVITWDWGKNPVIAFNPATDKLDFGWMGPTQFDVSEKSGSTVISVVDNNHTYTLSGVSLSQLSSSNIVAKDAATTSKWNSLFTSASQPSVSVGSASKAEGNSGTANMAFTVTLSKASTAPVTVKYATSNGTATAGQDYTSSTGTVTFAAGETSKTINVAITGDATVEPDETFTVTLSAPTGAKLGTASATGTITNDDAVVVAPTVSIGNASKTEGNSGTSNLAFTVTLSKASTTAVTVKYATANGTATAGQDYTAAKGTITFAAGETSKTVNVAVAGDATVEPDETFTVTLSAPSGATLGTATATGTITNDDVAVVPPTVSIGNASKSEGNSGTSNLAFTVTLSKASTTAVTVNFATSNGTATAGQDYTAAKGTITFAAGETSKTVNVAVAGDATVEPDETFTVTLSAPSGATLGTATATGTITNDDASTGGTGGGLNSGDAADAKWGEAFFAPYVDMAGWPPPNLSAIAQANGTSLLTLAFIQSTTDGKAAWGGYSTLTPGSSDEQAKTIDASIAAFKAAGGDVLVSFGGANGTSLAQYYYTHGGTAQQLANVYGGIVDAYGLNRIDFDIEGAAVADGSSALNAQALKLFQQAHPDVEVWYTLPVLPTGLTADGLNVVDQAVKAGVKLDGINVMAMDYGESAAPTSGPNAKTMGAYAIQSAQSTFDQMTTVFNKYGQTFNWRQIGVTPMIGVNDVQSEVFTAADAQALETFARSKGIGMLSMWSIQRDTPGSLGTASPSASGLSDPAGTFSKTWNDYGTVNTMTFPSGGGGTGGTPVTGGTTTVIGWHWGSNTVLNFDPAKDKLDFVWMQPTSFSVSDASGSTVITIIDNNQTYKLNGVKLSQLQMGNITALDSNTTAKWQTLIGNASQPSTPALPTVSVGNASKAEGSSGTSNLAFTVNLSKASTTPVTVQYATSNGTATAGQDYVAASGTVTFAAGETSKTVNVVVNGDATVEPDETLTLTLSSPSGATLATSSATGTITNDDVAPTLPTASIGNASKAEGNSGTSNMTFTVTLSKASTTPVTVQYATANGTATAGQDYVAASGTITFAAGETSKTVNVVVNGDATSESDETFTVTLSNPSGITIATAVATGTITNDDTSSGGGTGSTGGGLNSGNAGDQRWGETYYSPYVDMANWPVPNLTAIAQARGASLFNLGFIQSTSDGKAGWGGYSVLAPGGTDSQAQSIDASIAALKAAGGDVMVSFGGAAGISLAEYAASHGKSAQQLADIYAGVVDAYGLNRIDFDIEGAAIANQAAMTLNSQALKLLQTSHPDLEIWYTLPVLPTGLTSDGINVVDQALKAGVKVDGVNVMAMDYGDNAAPVTGPNAKTMGAYAIQSAQSTYDQMTPLFAKYGQTFNWRQIGVTPMIGVNDIESEVFTVADAQALEDFARTRGIGMVSMWSERRDTPGTPGRSTPDTSGLDVPAGSFSNIWKDYGTVNTVTAPAGGGTTGGGNTGGGTTGGGTTGGTTSAAAVSFTKTNDWTSGFNADMTVTNTGTQAISDWRLSFDYGGNISSIWNASIVSHTGNTYVIKPADWNTNIAAGSSTTFGFTATPSTPAPTNFVLNGTPVTAPGGGTTTGGTGGTPQTSQPKLSVANTNVQEGNSGSKDMVFDVTLSAPADHVVTVNYKTQDFTAAAGTDYQAVQGTLTFAVGETTKQVRVSINGDATYEGNESLLLVLSGASGAEFSTSQGVGLVVNDDANPNAGNAPEYHVVGYFAEWGIYGRNYHVSDIPAEKLTDINYAFANINSNGEVVLYDSYAATDRAYPGDTWDQTLRGNFNQLAKLKEKNPGVNTLISIGGWTLSGKFSDVAATQQAREKFAASAIKFMTTYGFDGIDLDWEYPVEGGLDGNTYRPEDGANYTLLVAEIRKQLTALEATDGVDKHYLLTIAAPAGYDKIENFDLDGMAPYLDWFDLMAYDMHGGTWEKKTGNQAGLYANPQSDQPLYNVDTAVQLYLSQGVDPSKIVLGSPMYGRSWQGVPDGGTHGLNQVGTGAGFGTYEAGVVDYWQIVDLTKQQPDMYHVYWDDKAKVPYIYSPINGGTFITYENPQSLQYKLDYIKDLGLGGVMFWELDGDVRNSDSPDSLLKLAADELLGDQSGA